MVIVDQLDSIVFDRLRFTLMYSSTVDRTLRSDLSGYVALTVKAEDERED